MKNLLTLPMRSLHPIALGCLVITQGCHWIFPYRATSADGDAAIAIDSRGDYSRRGEFGSAQDSIQDHVALPKDWGPVICSMDCGPIYSCCYKDNKPQCVSMGAADGCRCDPNTKEPCLNSSFPICCDKGDGKGLRCVSIGTTDGCSCNLGTKVPCLNTPFPSCCDQGNGPRCHGASVCP
jgi:hypothetical protein